MVKINNFLFIGATVLLLLSFFFLSAPFYTEAMYDPAHAHPPGYSYEDPAAPVCQKCNGPQCTQFGIPANATVKQYTQQCSDDDACRQFNGDCSSYCSLGGLCVNGTDTPCSSTQGGSGLYTHQCVTGQDYTNDPYKKHRTTAAAEAKKAAEVMNYFQYENGILPAQNGGYSIWMLGRWSLPFMMLHAMNQLDGSAKTHVALLAQAAAFLNTIAAGLALWTLTALGASIVWPPEYDFADWVYNGSALVITGTWFLFLSQALFLLIAVFFPGNSKGGYQPLSSPGDTGP